MFLCKSRQVINLLNKLNNERILLRSFSKITNRNYTAFRINARTVSAVDYNLQICRYKHKDTKKDKKTELMESDDEDDQESDDWGSDLVDKQTKLMTVKVNSLRADVVLKAGLGIARNKIETMFYESKIRVNGRKLLKKSAVLSVGDEVDIVRAASALNSDFLTVSRVEILSASERGEGLSVKLRRNKTLTIENYSEEPHKN